MEERKVDVEGRKEEIEGDVARTQRRGMEVEEAKLRGAGDT